MSAPHAIERKSDTRRKERKVSRERFEYNYDKNSHLKRPGTIHVISIFREIMKPAGLETKKFKGYENRGINPF